MNVKINAELREKGKKSDLKELRKHGYIPAVIYGEGKQGINIKLEKISFLKEYRTTIKEMAFFDVRIEGKTYKTIIKDKQIHPLSREIEHIDFLELHKGRPITVNVPLKFIGHAPGVAAGGVMDVLVRSLDVSCLPKDIPEDIEVDISELQIGETIHLGDIKLPEVDVKYPPDTALVSVHLLRKAEEKTAESTEEEAEIAESETEDIDA
ncbi:MAG: 50S ribosomal protein L25 [Candidatus Cloacimonetes bacterium]|nr:50S ribosomal protein L25 [Candidatus Cloacimonadota bacterium]